MTAESVEHDIRDEAVEHDVVLLSESVLSILRVLLNDDSLSVLEASDGVHHSLVRDVLIILTNVDQSGGGRGREAFSSERRDNSTDGDDSSESSGEAEADKETHPTSLGESSDEDLAGVIAVVSDSLVDVSSDETSAVTSLLFVDQLSDFIVLEVESDHIEPRRHLGLEGSDVLDGGSGKDNSESGSVFAEVLDPEVDVNSGVLSESVEPDEGVGGLHVLGGDDVELSVSNNVNLLIGLSDGVG